MGPSSSASCRARRSGVGASARGRSRASHTCRPCFSAVAWLVLTCAMTLAGTPQVALCCFKALDHLGLGREERLEQLAGLLGPGLLLAGVTQRIGVLLHLVAGGQEFLAGRRRPRAAGAAARRSLSPPPYMPGAPPPCRGPRIQACPASRRTGRATAQTARRRARAQRSARRGVMAFPHPSTCDLQPKWGVGWVEPLARPYAFEQVVGCWVSHSGLAQSRA